MTDIQLLDDNAIELVVDGNAQVITSVEWGEISGTLSNQTDLQNELNAINNSINSKADVSSVEALSSQVSEMSGDIGDITTSLNNKVDKVSGKGLSTNDFTNADKSKLDGVESGAEVNVIEDIKVDNVSLTPTNKSVNIDLSGKENVSNKTTTLSSASTDTQYPSAKCVYDYVDSIVGDIESLLEAI